MRRFLLLISLIMVPVAFGQLTTIIGDTTCETRTPYLPWWHDLNYSESQYGIPTDESAIFGTDPVLITKIGWYNCSNPPTTNYSLNVYIDQAPGFLDLSSLCSTQILNANLVASDKTLTENGSIYFLTLDTPFMYIQGHTLIISVCDTMEGKEIPYPSWAGQVFVENGYLRHSDAFTLDCDLATNDIGPSRRCASAWPTTWFEYSPYTSTYTMTMLSTSGPEAGFVSPSPGTTNYPMNDAANISATANPGFVFDYWELDGALYSYHRDETVLMDTDHTLQAFFKPFTHQSLPFIEDFSGLAPGVIPTNWERSHTNWQVCRTDSAGGVTPEMALIDLSPGNPDLYRLITPKLDGASASRILLTFKLKYWVTPGNYKRLCVQTSTDNGISWQDRWSEQAESISGEISVNLDAVAGTEFLLVFIFEGDIEKIQRLSIDDICVAETRELDMKIPAGRGAVAPSIGKQVIPMGQEITLRALPSSTWYAFDATDNPFLFDPGNPGFAIQLGTSSLWIRGGTWAAGTWYVTSQNPSNLYMVNPADGTLTLVGPTGQNALTGLAYDDVNDIMYTCTQAQLFTINRSTSELTLVGSFGEYRLIADLAFGDGVLYAHCLYNNCIFIVDTSTGATTALGSLQIELRSIAQGLEYDKDHDRLFMTVWNLRNDERCYLGEVDKTNGSVFLWTPLDLRGEIDGFAIPYSIDHPWKFDRWEVDGVFYSNDPITTLAMDTDYSIQAFFTTTQPTHTLTILPPGGTGSGSVSPVQGTHIYSADQTATISAATDHGSGFEYWEIDGAFVSDDLLNTLEMSSDHTAQAFFAVDPHQFCSPGDIFSQPVVANHSKIESDVYRNTFGADDFTGLTEPIIGVDFWGVEWDQTWIPCEKSSYDFIIRFYEYDELPETLVYQETITMTKTTSAKYLFGNPRYGPVYKYTAIFSEPVTLTDGWFSVQAVDSGSCIFSWVDSGFVTSSIDYLYAEESGGYWNKGYWTHNLAFCLLGEYPTPTPTNTPTFIPTPTSTPTEPPPTEPPSPTPTEPEPTPTFTPEPTPSYPLGVRLEMPDMAHPGDEFSIIGYLDNPDEPLTEVATFFILEVYGKFWFWPSWAYFDYPEYAEIDWENIDVSTGTTEVVVIPVFEWPDTGQDVVTGLGFYGAMLNPKMNDIMGGFAFKEWGYRPSR